MAKKPKNPKFKHEKEYRSFKEDENDPKVLHTTVTNAGRDPVVLEVRSRGLYNGGTITQDFTIFMTTRRSTVNPGESFKFRVVLDKSITEYTPGTELRIKFGHFSEITWLLSAPAGNKDEYRAERGIEVVLYG
jgi:hypothetical protein